MALKLKLENGEVKEYRTYYSEGGGEFGPSKHLTKCGLCWEKCPPAHEECDHTDCAIRVAEADIINIFGMGFLSICFGAILLREAIHFHRIAIGELVLDGIWTLAPGFSLIFIGMTAIRFAYGDHKKSQELNEFRKHGTVNGIQARRI